MLKIELPWWFFFALVALMFLPPIFSAFGLYYFLTKEHNYLIVGLASVIIIIRAIFIILKHSSTKSILGNLMALATPYNFWIAIFTRGFKEIPKLLNYMDGYFVLIFGLIMNYLAICGGLTLAQNLIARIFTLF